MKATRSIRQRQSVRAKRSGTPASPLYLLKRKKEAKTVTLLKKIFM
jgi:hypothetical protein